MGFDTGNHLRIIGSLRNLSPMEAYNVEISRTPGARRLS